MARYILFLTIFFVVVESLVLACLITNCPRGGKRSGKTTGITENNIKPCISCGPGKTGQCFGPNICCGPFGCHVGTQETIRCQREGFFHEREPCIAGNAFCRRNTGRCAIEGVCCTQESCHVDKSCSAEDKPRIQIADIATADLYNLLAYQNEYMGEK